MQTLTRLGAAPRRTAPPCADVEGQRRVLFHGFCTLFASELIHRPAIAARRDRSIYLPRWVTRCCTSTTVRAARCNDLDPYRLSPPGIRPRVTWPGSSSNRCVRYIDALGGSNSPDRTLPGALQLPEKAAAACSAAKPGAAAAPPGRNSPRRTAAGSDCAGAALPAACAERANRCCQH